MVRSSNSHSAVMPANNENSARPPPPLPPPLPQQQTRKPAMTPNDFAMPSAHNAAPKMAASPIIIVRTTTIEAPFHLAPASTMPIDIPRGVARDIAAYLGPPPLPSYKFDIIGDEVSVIMLPESKVVSKWREPALAPTPRRQSPPEPASAEPSPLGRQQIGYLGAETTMVPVRTLPAPQPAVPWSGPPKPHPLTLTPDAQPSPTSVVATHSADSHNSTVDRGRPRLPDGYIALISVAALFVCATLFYFFVRYAKRRKTSPSPSPSPPPGSRNASASDAELKRQASASRTNLPDSGTAINFTQKPTDTPGTEPVSLHQPSALFPVPGHYAVDRYASLHEQDRMADDALKGRYFNYRHPGTEGGALRQNSHSARPRVPSFQGRVATDSPGQLETPRPFVAQYQADVRQYSVDRAAGNPAEPNPLSASCADLKGKCVLLDTSAANPSLGAKPGSSPRTRAKPRKLIRDPKRAASAAAATPNKSPSGGVLAEADGEKAEQSKSNMSLRSKLWSSSPAAKKEPDAVQPSVPRAEEPGLSPLMDSIESFSESYHFAIRHKPPLGPLRVVEPHMPALPDELAIARGHCLFVIGEFADGWVLAINASNNNACGMVPRRCMFFPTAPFMTSDAITASMSPALSAKSVPRSGI